MVRLAAVLGVAMVASLVSTSPASPAKEGAATGVSAAAAEPAPLREAPDLASATRAARKQGTRVEVANLRAENRTVFAEPSGTSMLELSAAPVRARKGSGWAAIDTTLAWRADGSIGPGAAPVDLAFSGGGTAPLVAFGKDGKRITLTWPGPLPAPSLSGATATYREVFRGIDLVMRAESTGYTQHLVVKNAAAASTLSRVRLGMRTAGLKVSVTRAGGLEARDARGAVAFFAPPSAMWDSGTPARRAIAKVSITTTSLSIVPDQTLLKSPVAKFPIIVDPNWQAYGRTFWTSVSSGNANTPYPNSSPTGPNIAQVGLCGFSDCNGIGVTRSYFQYDTGWAGLLVNKRIMGVWLDTAVIHSPNCSDREQHLHFTGGVNNGTTWNNAPGGAHVTSAIAPRSYAAGNCGGWKAMSFEIPVFHINRYGTSTYYIAAGNEGDSLFWRKHDPHATNLRVRFNTAPNPPTNVHSDPAVPASCTNCAGKRYVGGSSMRLIAGLSDPDGNAVHPEWHIYANGERRVEYGSPQVNGTHDTTIGLTDGTVIDWSVAAWDTDENTGLRLDFNGFIRGAGAPFTVDRTAPSSAPRVSGLLYQNDNRWHGGIDVPGTFVLERTKVTGSDPGTADVDHYLWGTQSPPTTKADADALGGKASVTFTPGRDGPQDLFVRSVDRAGNMSPVETYHFYVRAGSGPLAQWSFEGNTTDDAYLGDRDGTLNGRPTYGPGAVGSAIHLAGQGDSVSAPNVVRTDGSFSVSAWVKPDQLPAGQMMTAVSQDGNSSSGFYLNYRGDLQRTTFMLVSADQDRPTEHTAVGPALRLGTWTHLTGVYDRPKNEIRLYVNGVRAAESALPANFVPWYANGPLSIGRHRWNSLYGGGWLGSIDEVKIYDRVLSAEEVRAAVGRDNVQAGHWRLDESSGSTARNEVDGGESMVLHNGATFTGSTGGAVNGGVRLDGVDDHATTTGPVMRTDQSFTVAAWVNATAKPTMADYQAAVTADGTVNSAFSLGYRELTTGSKWEFVVPSADANARPADALVRSSVTAALNTPTHLAGVYDAAAGQVRLYVNGVLAGTAARPNGFHATGPLTVGRGRWEGAIVDYWTGVVDEVRAYSRELTESEIQGIVARSNVTAGTWKLDGNANDSSGNNRNGTLTGEPDWAGGQTNVPAPTDLAVRLNGSTAHVVAPHSFDVTKSFAVTAWARLDSATGVPTVLSQDGSRVSAFKLRARPDGKWSFMMSGTDADGGGTWTEVFGGAAQIGAWTHLVAIYDSSARQISLYINGVLAGVKPHTQTWDYPAGSLQMGRSRWNGQHVEYFTGAIDDVTVYSRVLFADEIITMAGRDLTLAHNWALDEPSGSNAADGVGARAGTVGGATHVPGKLGNALRFNGTSDTVSTTGVDIDTSKNFTVASWVKLRRVCDRGGESSCKLTAVSLDGGQPSKFRLGHIVDDDNHQLGAWIFEMPESDGSVTKASVSAVSSDVDRWVHLVGVYDAQAKQIWLYVNATRQDDGTLDVPWAASGGLQLGRGRVAGAAAEFWDGEIDDVRLYAGKLDKSRIESLFASYPVQGGGPANLPVADAGHWRFDEGTGTTAADSSGRALTATMKGGAGWIGGRNGNSGWFDGTSGYAETAGPVLNTAGSFSASAWVYLTGASTGHRTVLGQDGAQFSAFLLSYQDENKRWAVVVPGSPHIFLRSTELAARDEWTHLAVVYDANLRQLRLYVQGALSAAMTGVTVPASSGPFSIGRVKWTGGNSDFFLRGIDDVRAFSRALSDGEVRRVHDDVYSAMLDFYRFDDGTARDYGWRANHGTASGGVSYGPGVFYVGNQALYLDGSTGSVSTTWRAAVMADSFTVSAWAKIANKSRVATVLAQDGQRRSAFVLQYRPAQDRWVFGGPAQDVDAAESLFAVSAKSPPADQWTHLVGAYDRSAGELRLYVDGELAGTRKGVVLPDAHGGFTIGRGKYDGKAVDFFQGAIDEVRSEQGVASAADIAVRAGWAAPPGGQLGRYVNAAGDHYTDSTDKPVRTGYHFEGTLGRLVADGPNTKPLYACMVNADAFTSDEPDCEGKAVLGEIGRVYTVQPSNLATMPIHSCSTGPDHFESPDSNCEGKPFEHLLGYTVAVAPLARYYSVYNNTDHWSTTQGTGPAYKLEGAHGWLPLTTQPGTTALMSCLDGTDEFTSVAANCEGKTTIGRIGYIYTAVPPGISTEPIYRCLVNGQRFTSRSATCNGYIVDRPLGHVLTDPPATIPTFG